MVLILSTPRDIDTNGVIQWLNHFNIKYFRLNDEDLFDSSISFSYDLNLENVLLKKENLEINFDDVKVVWFRKFGFLYSYDSFFKEFDSSSNMLKYCYSEFDKIRKLLFKSLEKKKWLYYQGSMPTKLENLSLAQKSGLMVPQTIVTSNKSSLIKFYKDLNKEIITKSLGETTQIKVKNYKIPLLTTKFKIKDLTQGEFSPSCFQEYISKAYELRIFFIGNQLFPMAMFTQHSSKTATDYRNYNYKKPARRVPYKLPNRIVKHIKSFTNKLNIDSGSIDMIKSTRGDYIFLEVNPTGQFGMTAVPCNYPLHKKIALHLKKIEYNEGN